MSTDLITDSQQKRELWLAAIKPPMYTVAIIPIIAGTATAIADQYSLNIKIFLLFLASAIAIIAWLNLSNDVFDSDTGIDINKAHSVVNLTGNRSLVFWLSNLFLLFGIFGIIFIAWWQKDWTVLFIILFCCLLGYTYQGPPFRLGYLGLGEIICFFTFGPGAVGAAYYAQTQTFSLTTWLVSVIIGLNTSIILFCSHFHQVKDDLAAGKKSPIVRLGTKKGSFCLKVATIGVFGLVAFFVVCGWLKPTSLLFFASLPFAYQLIHHVEKYHAIPEKVSNCKFLAVNLHFLSGLCLAVGLVWGAN